MRVEETHRFTVVHAKRPVLIDHYLASRPLAVGCKGVTILNEGLQDEVKAEEPILGSLHAPRHRVFVLNVTTAGCAAIPDENNTLIHSTIDQRQVDISLPCCRQVVAAACCARWSQDGTPLRLSEGTRQTGADHRATCLYSADP